MSSVNTNHNLQYRKYWLIIGWILILTIIYLTLTPKVPDLNKGIPFGDKIAHLAAYAILMFWFCQLYIKNSSRILLVSAFVFMGVTLEFLQGLGGVRMYEVADMLANSTGVLIGFCLTYFWMSDLLHRFENKIGLAKAK